MAYEILNYLSNNTLHKIKTIIFTSDPFLRRFIYCFAQIEFYSRFNSFLRYKFYSATYNLNKSSILHDKNYAKEAANSEKYNQDFLLQNFLFH